MKSFLAVVAGLVFTIVVTARLAPRNPMKHALVLGAIGMALALVGVRLSSKKGPEFGPAWYAWALVATALPCAWIGGKLQKS